MVFLLTCAFCQAATGNVWTGTWAAAAEYTGQGDMPKSPLTDRSLREIVRVSIGGEKVRVTLSNEFSSSPLKIRSVFIADAADSCDIRPATAKYLTFDKKRAVTVAAGQSVRSDAVNYRLRPLQRLAVTICYGDETPEHATSHRGSRTTSYIISGEARPKTSFAQGERVDHWYGISAIDVLSDAGSIAIIGNSITDGRGSTVNAQNRWPDVMSSVLQKNGVSMGVLNLGIGGNSVYYGGLSEPACKRFDRDILCQANVKYVIIYEGVNDLGSADKDAEQRAYKLIEIYQEMIRKCHDRGIKVIGATIMPFGKSFYEDHFKDAARQYVNQWIRTSGAYDAVIDFDALLRDTDNPQCLQQPYQEDWLHPNAAGYARMGRFAAEELMKVL